LAQKHGTSLAVVVLDLDNFKFFNDAYGHAVGDDVLRQVAAVLKAACRARDTLARFGGDEFALLLPDLEGEISAAAVASLLEADLGDVTYQPPGYGSAIPVSLSLGVALFPSEAPTRLAVMQIADERLLRAKTGAFTDAEAQRVRGIMRDAVQGFSMLDALVSAVDNKDRYTRRHSEDVMTYSLQIARVLGFSDSEQQIVAAAALLHDVGKIGVPDHILRKPGKLTEEDFEAVKMHPSIGAVIVAAVPGLEATVDAVRHHHERWDGGGYPAGWSGAATPLMARLMAVADAYSAMTTDRPYRKGMSPAEAKRILVQGAGAQWDPDCVQAFLAG
jgi:diguanylate cyclase (GGDEF)-like protein